MKYILLLIITAFSFTSFSPSFAQANPNNLDLGYEQNQNDDNTGDQDEETNDENSGRNSSEEYEEKAEPDN